MVNLGLLAPTTVSAWLGNAQEAELLCCPALVTTAAVLGEPTCPPGKQTLIYLV